MNNQLFTDAMTATFIQSQKDEEKTTVPLMINVSVKWLNAIKSLAENLGTDLGSLSEAILLSIFAAGFDACNKDLQSRYPEPLDLFKELFGVAP